MHDADGLTRGLQAELAARILAELARRRPAPGSRVNTQALAAAFQVSRTPVRGALGLLAAQGWLAPQRGRGFVVARLPQPAPQPPPQAAPGASAAAPDLAAALLRDRAAGALDVDVSERALVERYRATPGIVRRALVALTSEGLVQRLPGHGWRFSDALAGPDAVAESYAFREAVECGAILVPGYRLAPAVIAQLRHAHQAMLEAATQIEPAHWVDTNTAFHEAVAAGSGNRFFVEAVRRQNALRRLQERADFAALTPARIRQSCAEHLAILEALAEPDPHWAAALMRRHLTRAAVPPHPDPAPV